MTVAVSGTARTASASSWVKVAPGSLWDWRGMTSSAAGLERQAAGLRHQEKNARSATSARAWVDHESGVPSGFLRKRDVALVGLQDRERDVGGRSTPRSSAQAAKVASQ